MSLKNTLVVRALLNRIKKNTDSVGYQIFDTKARKSKQTKLSDFLKQYFEGILNLMNSLVVNTVPDDIVSTSDATIASSSTASSRLYVEYLFLVNVDQAYEYAENSTLTPEERVGMFYMRSRISQIELEKKRKVVS